MEPCRGCGSTRIMVDHRRGEVICKNCGLIQEDILFDFGPEWRAFDEEQMNKRSRAGGPLKFAKQNIGLTTEIDKYDRDIKGSAVPTERKAQLYRLRKWQRRSRMGTSVDRNLSIALPELDRMCAHLNIAQNIKEECARWYRKCVNKGIVRGRSIESVIAAIIYLVSRRHQLPKTLRELEEVSGVKKKDIGRSYRTICRRLRLRMPVVTAADYVPRLASELGVSGKTEAKAIEMLERARKRGIISGKVPISIAAAAIYLAGRITNDKQTETIVGFSEVPESAIKNRYDELIREFRMGDSLKKHPVPQPS
ncbi:MAG: transcription initiation factor IIB [Candidatus Altiarchaeales archaeon ex4484_43]|nr:MAG: transcription initiation factor IIB [Candidatus Altiarchaeales archaeon ex4484_43]RLI89569.1 MAG: transcription initiation factor IIB [Candidatus Altiarchaeales archaeon]